MRLIQFVLTIALFLAVACATSCTKTEPATPPVSPEENEPAIDLVENPMPGELFKSKQLADSLIAEKKKTEEARQRIPKPPIVRVRERPMKKPVIYLYPAFEMEVTVRFQAYGDIIATYPEYNSGWTVHATAEGKLTDLSDGQPHNYLFYECELPHSYLLESGFLVKADSVIPFLQRTLKQIGLLPAEYNDMISYWLPQLKQKPWNVIHFTLNKEYDKLSTLQVIPAPDSQLRVMMEFVGLDSPVSLPVQTLPHFERKGFTVVEWGGVEFSIENLPLAF